MSLEHTPLDPAALSEPARRALAGPGPLKLMAARGLAPLPRPADLASVLYQLVLDPDAAIRAAAEKTALELPERVLLGALGDVTLDARVLDYFAPRIAARPAVLEALLLNRATADDTVCELAKLGGEHAIELIATNQERLIRFPKLIAAVYLNPKARMSTVDRVLEQAIRAGLTIPEIPSWSELVDAILGTVRLAPGLEATAIVVPIAPTLEQTYAADALFASVATFAVGEASATNLVLEADTFLDADEADTGHEGLKTKKQVQVETLSVPAKIRLATLGNSFARATLVRDRNRQVALAVINSPAMTDNEVIKYASSRNVSDEVIRVIANRKEWTKLYAVRIALVKNPKTPLPMAMRMLPLLHPKDMKLLAGSKGIPSALATQAKKLVTAKQR